MSEQFEEAVELTLAHMARVDASTVLDTRATIAALPDRRWTRAVRVRRSVSGVSLPRWPRAVALAGAAVVVVAVVAVSMFGALQRRPVGPNSPAPSMATPSTSSSASPGVMPTPSAIRTGPAYSETLPVLLTGNHVWFAGWSPDGSRYAIGADGADSNVVHLFDRSGTEIGSVAGGQQFAFAWLDANRFVVIATEDRVNPPGPLYAFGPVGAFMGRVGSTQLTKLGEYDTLVAGPSGSVALAHIGDPSLTTARPYVVVSADGSVSNLRDGTPLAWSRDGSMLAVYHATGLAPVPALGWLEVVRSTGESVASTHGLTFAEPYAVFSPDGARVAFSYDPEPLTGAAQMAILEIASGHVTIVPKSGYLAWASSDQLLFAYTSIDYGQTPGGIYSWSAATGLVTTYGPGDTVGASGQGTVIIGSDTSLVLTWTKTTGGSTRTGTFSVGYYPSFGNYISDSAWSPDGSSLILTVGDWNYGTAMDAVLFRP